DPNNRPASASETADLLRKIDVKAKPVATLTATAEGRQKDSPSANPGPWWADQAVEVWDEERILKSNRQGVQNTPIDSTDAKPGNRRRMSIVFAITFVLTLGIFLGIRSLVGGKGATIANTETTPTVDDSSKSNTKQGPGASGDKKSNTDNTVETSQPGDPLTF